MDLIHFVYSNCYTSIRFRVLIISIRKVKEIDWRLFFCLTDIIICSISTRCGSVVAITIVKDLIIGPSNHTNEKVFGLVSLRWKNTYANMFHFSVCLVKRPGMPWCIVLYLLSFIHRCSKITELGSHASVLSLQFCYMLTTIWGFMNIQHVVSSWQQSTKEMLVCVQLYVFAWIWPSDSVKRNSDLPKEFQSLLLNLFNARICAFPSTTANFGTIRSDKNDHNMATLEINLVNEILAFM